MFAESADGAREVIEAARESATESAPRTSTVSMCCWPCYANRKASPNEHLLTSASIAEPSSTLREEVSRDENSRSYLKSLEAKSIAAAKWLGDDYAGTQHVLIALCQIRPSAATDTLMHWRWAARYLPTGARHPGPRRRLAGLAGGPSGYVSGEGWGPARSSFPRSAWKREMATLCVARVNTEASVAS